MLLLIDNYDSFTYNLVHYLGELGEDVRVVRNDAMDVASAMALRPHAIVLSPGPCDPDQAGICLALTLWTAFLPRPTAAPRYCALCRRSTTRAACLARATSLSCR